MRFSAKGGMLFALPALVILLLGCEQGSAPSSLDTVLTAPRHSHGPDGMATARVRLRPVNDSGVHGMITLLDNGATVIINGTASGLDPGNTDGYGSATYDLASAVQGPQACEPGRQVGVGTDHRLSLTLGQMTIGSFFLEPVWVVDAGGMGTLLNETLLEYVSVDRIGTVSIRDRRIVGPFGSGTGPAAVVACGRATP